jgi:hypothetical protein
MAWLVRRHNTATGHGGTALFVVIVHANALFGEQVL